MGTLGDLMTETYIEYDVDDPIRIKYYHQAIQYNMVALFARAKSYNGESGSGQVITYYDADGNIIGESKNGTMHVTEHFQPKMHEYFQMIRKVNPERVAEEIISV